MQQKVRLFEFDRSRLSESENKVVDILLQAGEVIHDIWLKQLDNGSGRITMYPDDATAEEILEAAEKDPSLLSGTTVVKRDGGKLIAVDYVDEYREDLKVFTGLLAQARDVSEDKDLNEYINKIIDACDKGNYQGALLAFLENPETNIEFLVGPIETYEDHLLGRKKTFQFNLRVLKQDATKDILKMIEVMKYVRLPQPEASVGAKLDVAKIRVRIDEVLMFAGRQSTLLVSSTNLPNEAELVKDHGTKVIVYTTSMSKKFDERHVPLLPYITVDTAKDDIEKMRAAMFKLVSLHEIAEGTIKFPSMESRLKSSYAYIRELNADVVGVHSAKYHLLNGLSTIDEYKDLLRAFVVFAVDLCNKYEESRSLLDYAKGFAIMFNYSFNTGALRIESGKMIIDPMQLSSDIEWLSNLTIRILEEGTEADAQKLSDEYGDLSIFEKLPKVV